MEVDFLSSLSLTQSNLLTNKLIYILVTIIYTKLICIINTTNNPLCELQVTLFGVLHDFGDHGNKKENNRSIVSQIKYTTKKIHRGVAQGLHSSILNMFNVSKSYLSLEIKILSSIYKIRCRDRNVINQGWSFQMYLSTSPSNPKSS